MTTDVSISELKDLLSKSTEGDWWAPEEHNVRAGRLICQYDPMNDADDGIPIVRTSAWNKDNNAKLIVFLRNNAENIINTIESERAKSVRLQEQVKKLRGVLKELHTTVWNESPHLLDDDRGGDWKLDIGIEEALKETAG